MQLRAALEPRLDIAQQLYPEILKSILDYTDFVDENTDEENIEYQKLEDKLHALTGKDMSRFDLYEWWEQESAEVFAFTIALPDPQKVENITKEELAEIIRRISSSHFEGLTWEIAADRGVETLTFIEYWSLYLDDYYHTLLELNFKTYNYSKLFSRQKKKEKKDFYWYTDEEKIEKLWNNGVF